MPLPVTTDRVIVRSRWLDETTGLGVRDGNSPATVAYTPKPLSGSGTPVLRDNTAHTYIKTRTITATVNGATGYHAAVVISTNDPDTDGTVKFAGREVAFSGEPSFLIAVPYNAPLVAADAEMVAAVPGLVLNQMVRAMWLDECPIIDGNPPTPPQSYWNTTQTLSAINTGIDLHDDDPSAHPDIRALATGPRPPSGGAGGVLAGSYPNPGFAQNMVVEAELAEKVQDIVAAMLVQGAGITLAYNDPAGTLTITSTGGGSGGSGYGAGGYGTSSYGG